MEVIDKNIHPSPEGADLNLLRFNRNIDELIPRLSKNKYNLERYLHRNFTQNVHYIVIPLKRVESDKKKHGGHNKIDFLLTDEGFTLLENSFNLRNRNIISISPNTKMMKYVMPIETQTIGFIVNSYGKSVETVRQYYVGSYRVDLYFPKYKIIVECDEFDHKDRDKKYESERETYLILQGNKIIRYNPNDPNFDLSDVLQKINNIIILSN